MIPADARQQLQTIVGAEHVLDGELDRFGYSYDSSFVPFDRAHQPDLVVRPGDTAQVAAVLVLAQARGIPVTARGTASGRSGGCVPLAGGIALAMGRMDRILELDERNMMVRVQPGVRTMDLYGHCAARGLFYPPDPASWKYSTLGGNVAENAGGMRAVKYGVTSSYVMGLEVVLADGSVIRTGGKAIKNVTGYNLTQLFVGSEGTLGVVTEILLRLIPMPPARTTLQLLFGSLEDAGDTVHAILQAGMVPAAAELMDGISLQAVARHQDLAIDPGIEACLVLELDGPDPAALAEQAARIEAIARDHRAAGTRVAAGPEESEAIWAIRRGLSSAIGAMAPDRFGEDISVPRDAFPEMIRRIRGIARDHDLTIAVYGHAGDGNVHPSVLADLARPGQEERVHRAIEAIFRAALDLGGTLSGEHGIGITKKPYLELALGRAGVAALKAVKAALDPKGILNPGKIWEDRP
jgi:glycolate oxidase